MNIFITAILCVLITDIYANFNVTYQSPNRTMLTSAHEFTIEIDHEVNPPGFSSYIHIYENSTTNQLAYTIDASTKTSNISYVNKTLIFHTPDNFTGKINTSYYIELDVGVLFSGNISNSTAKTGSEFWTWRYVGDDKTSTTTTVSSFTTSNNDNATDETDTTRSGSTLSVLPTGETPPTRSAQLGMGLSMTLIGILLVVEILYFKRFYRGHLQNDNYVV